MAAAGFSGAGCSGTTRTVRSWGRFGGLRVLLAVSFCVSLVACSSTDDVVDEIVMPDVVGVQLDVALSDIERAGIEDDVEIIGGGTFGVVDESNWQVCEQLPDAGDPVTVEPRLVVERSCPELEEVATEPAVAEPETAEPAVTEPETTEPAVTEPKSTEPVVTQPATTEPDVTEPDVPATTLAPYVYSGPPYEIIVSGPLPIGVDEYWVLIDPLDYSTDAYRDEIKSIIADIARTEGTPNLAVSVVTDREVALYRSFTTGLEFSEENSSDYIAEVVRPKEVTARIADYTGGFDFNTNELSNDPAAYEIIWGIGTDSPEFEQWKPE